MSDGKLRAGQEYLRHQDIVAPFTEQVVEYTNPTDPAEEKVTGQEGNPATEIIPKDQGSATVRIYDKAAILAALASVYFQFPSNVSLNLPDVLNSITTVWNNNHGDGSSSHLAANMTAEFVGGGEAHLTPRATAQGSASLMPDLQINTTSYREAGRSVPATNLLFYMASPLLGADLVARIEDILGIVSLFDMPIFKPRGHTIACQGQQVSVQATADSSGVVSASSAGSSYSFSSEWGNGFSHDKGVSNKTIVLPPMLHGSISYDASMTQDVTAEVHADMIDLFIGSSVYVHAHDNPPSSDHTFPVKATASATVSPSSLGPTSPADIPKSGYYMADLNVNLADFGLLMVHVAIVNMSQFA